MTDGQGIRRTNRPVEHGWTVRTVSETGSTNADVLAAIDRGEALGGTVLRAEHQTAGRGRLDRTWDAPPGANLLASLCFDDVPVEPAELTQAVGLAAVRSVDRVDPSGSDGGAAHPAGLKWPNDVLLGDAKLAGVLAQRSARGPVVVGIGLNVRWAPEGSACLARELGVDVDPAALLDLLLAELDEHLRLDRATRHIRYVERLNTLGRTVRIQRPAGGDLVGVAQGVDESGRLLVRSVQSDVLEAVDVGDIVHLRTPLIDQ
jgi:BirA family biotin operon repressor/biotin-[acetyl-CoA-carboxylase] ligase